MTNKMIGAAVRRELKQAGYSPREVSVSVKDSLYDTAIKVHIKTAEIRASTIQQMLQHWESYEIDQRTQEILQGGNTYLLVSYAPTAWDHIPETYTTAASVIMEGLAAYPDQQGHQIANHPDGSSLHLINMAPRWRLLECQPTGSQQGQYIYGINDLATALWRYDAIGTAAP